MLNVVCPKQRMVQPVRAEVILPTGGNARIRVVWTAVVERANRQENREWTESKRLGHGARSGRVLLSESLSLCAPGRGLCTFPGRAAGNGKLLRKSALRAGAARWVDQVTIVTSRRRRNHRSALHPGIRGLRSTRHRANARACPRTPICHSGDRGIALAHPRQGRFAEWLATGQAGPRPRPVGRG